MSLWIIVAVVVALLILKFIFKPLFKLFALVALGLIVWWFFHNNSL